MNSDPHNSDPHDSGYAHTEDATVSLPPRGIESTHLGPIQLDEGFELTQDGDRGLRDVAGPRVKSRQTSHLEHVVGGTLGTFKLIREIGRGGMGMVYEAFEESLQRRVALKVLPLAGLMDGQHIRRFQNEAAAAAQLSHPNIVPVYSVGVDRGVHYYAMRMIDGRDLSVVIRSIQQHFQEHSGAGPTNAKPDGMGSTNEGVHNKTPLNGRNRSQPTGSIGQDLTPEGYSAAIHSRKNHASADKLFHAVARLGYDVADALHHAHEQGVIHRDIKPSNLLLDDNGKVWVTDFGLAMVRDSPGGTRTGDVVGTLRYMSPEQASGRRFLVDSRTDIYSLGISLYELLTLRQAFNGKGANEIIRQVSFTSPAAPRSINSRIPSELETIILKSISKNPQDRYATAGELAEDLQRFLSGKPIVARRPSMRRRIREWTLRHSTLAAVLAVFVLVTTVLSAASSAIIYQFLQSEVAQKKKAISLLEMSEGLRLVANSSLVLSDNPSLAMSLAAEGAKHSPGIEANAALQKAIDANHEISQTFTGELSPAHVSLAADSRQAICTSIPQSDNKQILPALLVNLDSGRTVASLQMEASATSATFSPMGRLVLTASSTLSQPWNPVATLPKAAHSAPILWNATTGTRLQTFRQSHLPFASEQAFSNDERIVVLPGPANDVTAFDTANGQTRFVMRGHSHPVLHAIFSRDNSLIATIDISGVIRFWRVADGAFIREVTGLSAPVKINPLIFCDSPRRLIVCTKDGTRALDPDNAESGIFLHAPNAAVNQSGRFVATWFSSYQSVNVNDTLTGEIVCQLTTARSVTAVALNPDGSQLAVASGNRTVVYSTADANPLFELAGHEDTVRGIQFTNDGQQIVTFSNDRTVRRWDIRSGRNKRQSSIHSDPRSMAQPALSHDDQLVLTPSTSTSNVRIYDSKGNTIEGSANGVLQTDTFDAERVCLVDGMTVSVVEPSTSRVIKSHRFSGRQILKTIPVPGGDRIVVLQSAGPTLLWNVSDDTTIPLLTKDQSVTRCVVSHDNSRIALATASGLCIVADARSGATVRKLQHDNAMSSIQFWPESEKVLTVKQGNVACIWGESDEAPESVLQDSTVEFDLAFVTADAKSIVTVKEYGVGQAACWNAETGEVESKLACSSGTRFALHPVERKLLLASRKAGVQLWDLTNNPATQISSLPSTKAVFLGDMIVANEFAAATNFTVKGVFVDPNALSVHVVGFDAATGQRITEFGSAEEGSMGTFSICPEALRVAINLPRHRSALTDRKASSESRLIGDHSQVISFAEFLPKSHEVVTCSWDGRACHWDSNGGSLRTFDAHAGPITTACIDATGTRLVCGYANGTVIDWNIETGDELRRMEDSKEPVRSLEFDSNGSLLILSGSSEVRYWNIQLNSVATATVAEPVERVSLSQGGLHVLIVPEQQNSNNPVTDEQSPASNAVVWKPADDTILPVALESRGIVGQFSPINQVFAVASADGQVHLLRLSDDGSIARLHTLPADKTPVRGLCFSPDGLLLAVGRETGISLWETESGTRLHDVSVSEEFLIRFNTESNVNPWKAFSPSGHLLIASTGQNVWWPVSPLDFALSQPVRDFTASEKSRFKIGLAQPALGTP